jgi:hypothetical protein
LRKRDIDRNARLLHVEEKLVFIEIGWRELHGVANAQAGMEQEQCERVPLPGCILQNGLDFLLGERERWRVG